MLDLSSSENYARSIVANANYWTVYDVKKNSRVVFQDFTSARNYSTMQTSSSLVYAVSGSSQALYASWDGKEFQTQPEFQTGKTGETKMSKFFYKGELIAKTSRGDEEIVLEDQPNSALTMIYNRYKAADKPEVKKFSEKEVAIRRVADVLTTYAAVNNKEDPEMAKKTKKEAAAPKGGRAKYNRQAKIKLLVKENPLREGTKVCGLFAKYENGMTLEDALKISATHKGEKVVLAMPDVIYHISKGWIELRD